MLAAQTQAQLPPPFEVVTVLNSMPGNTAEHHRPDRPAGPWRVVGNDNYAESDSGKGDSRDIRAVAACSKRE